MQDVDSNNPEDEAEGPTFDFFRSITSSENNADILESLFQDFSPNLSIFRDEEVDILDELGDFAEADEFIVREGDDISYLGNLIGKSTRLEFLHLWDMPLNDSFRDGLAANKSIKEIYVSSDLGYNGFRCLAPFFRNTNSIEALGVLFIADSISSESIKGFALLLSQCQIPSLKRIYFEEIELNDNEYTEFARALSMQPQLEELYLTNLCLNGFGDDNDSFLGHITLGATMKNWKSPCLKVLDLESSHNDDFALLPLVDDDGILSLVEGMENCINLEHLNLAGNDRITEVGLRALSSLFQSKKFLRSIDLRDTNISDEGMAVLAPGLASLRLLKKLDLSNNNIGDEGLQALASVQPNFHHLEELFLGSSATYSRTGQTLLTGSNRCFLAVGLKALSRVLQTVSSLKSLDLSNNSIDGKGLHAFMMEVDERFTIQSLILTNNAISRVGPFEKSEKSFCQLILRNDDSGGNNEAMEALVKAIESLRKLEDLNVEGVTSSGLSILAPVLQSESCSLQKLDLCKTILEDSGAIALANSLRGNKSLTKVCFDHRSLTDLGWRAFERLLCDTSNVNNTYRSNHSLERIGNCYHYQDRCPASIESLLDLNRQKDEGVNVPMCKILMSHSDIDMTPLLQWTLKLLPFVVTWFERAQSSQPIRSMNWFERVRSSQPTPTHSRTELECRKLSAMYQFIGGASQSVVEDYCTSSVSFASNSRKRKIK